MQGNNEYVDTIAIVGMSGRFPGANNIDQFWENLCEGKESLRHFSQEEINKAIGIHDYPSIPLLSKQVKTTKWVNAAFCLDDIDKFDAEFFGYTPNEAELLDPQQRLFLETSWAALEDAGYIPDEYPGIVGIYGGAGLSRYFLYNVFSNREIMHSSRDLTAGIGNEPDYVTNRVAYKLNLRGPSVSVQTACSTSLVAIHMASQSLLTGECDFALAGGVIVNAPASIGYPYQEGSMASPDGHIRTFDAKAEGTVFSEGGVGVVCLKRTEDALKDGDHIYAIIRGSAVNNDGSVKVGYTAPSVDGQVHVIGQALMVAGVSPEEIGYVEAHGTGTPLGDPIEINALSKAYRQSTVKEKYCAIGSLKPNVGHLAPAAGVASTIKAALVVKHGLIPPSINFDTPNTRIDFDASPFYVNHSLSDWKPENRKRVAAVSSFGIGGTNAHLVMEEPPTTAQTEDSQELKVFLLSARSAGALKNVVNNLSAYIEKHPNVNTRDIAYTLRTGRKKFDHRVTVVADSYISLKEELHKLHTKSTDKKSVDSNKKMAFMFSGQGSQYVNMGRDLYENLAVFRDKMDECFDTIKKISGEDLKDLVFPASTGKSEIFAETLRQTNVAQLVLFSIEYSLAFQLKSWGIIPDGMIGHSIGEYTAAALAEVFSIESALRLIKLRGDLMQSMPAGSMLSVSMDASEVGVYLNEDICLAADNANKTTVLSGPTKRIEQLQKELEAKGLGARILITSHAFHSSMMQPIVQKYIDAVSTMKPQAPIYPYISNVSGDWITAEQATDPNYWGQHLRGTVNFRQGVEKLMSENFGFFVEVGPSNALTTFTTRIGSSLKQNIGCVSTIRHPKEEANDHKFIMEALGQIWSHGCNLDWSSIVSEQGNKISLPTYPFNRDKHWVDPKNVSDSGLDKALGKRENPEKWFYVPSWKKQSVGLVNINLDDSFANKYVILFAVDNAFSRGLKEELQARKVNVVVVRPGKTYNQIGQFEYEIDTSNPQHYEKMLSDIGDLSDLRAVLHTLNHDVVKNKLTLDNYGQFVESAFYSLLFLTQSLYQAKSGEKIALLTLSSELNDVYPTDAINAAKSTVSGIHLCIGHEYDNIASRNIDITPNGRISDKTEYSIVISELHRLYQEADVPLIPSDKFVAYRDGFRWVADYEYVPVKETGKNILIDKNGVYLITGGVGGLALEFAEYLTGHGAKRIGLMVRSTFPAKELWEDWIRTNGELDSTSQKILKLKKLERSGAEITVVQGDITNLEQTRRAIIEVKKNRRISGIFHTAGVAGGGMMQLKTRDIADKVLLPKIKGVLILQKVLAECQSDSNPDFIVLFSSMFAVVGGVGQVDYSAANNVMDAFAREETLRGGKNVISINWGGWRDVGMAVNSGMMPKSPEAAKLPGEKQLTHPFLFNALIKDDKKAHYVSYLTVEGNWALQEHRIQSRSAMPGTGLLETVRAAFSDYTGSKYVDLSNVYFYQPLFVDDTELVKCDIIFTKTNGNNYLLEVSANLGGKKENYISGEITVGDAEFRKRDLSELQAQTQVIYSRDSEKNKVILHDENFLQLGPHWDVIESISIGADVLYGRLKLADNLAKDIKSYVFHPSLLDMATGPITGHLLLTLNLDLDGEYLPFSYGRISQKAPLPSEIVTFVKYRGISEAKDSIYFDINIYNLNGNELIAIEEFTLKHVPKMAFGNTSAKNSGNEIDYLDDSITPNEGIEVFNRLLQFTGQPQWVISVQDLNALLEKSKQEKLERKDKTQNRKKTQREDSNVTPPRNHVEELLVEIYQNVLGIEPIGIYDNFFDLGGDSVIGIQIVSQAKAFGIVIKPNQFFQFQTIAELSSVVEHNTAGTGNKTDNDVALNRGGASEPESANSFDLDISADDIETILESIE